MLNDLIIYTPMYVTFFWTILLLSTFRQNNKAKYFLGIFMFAAFLIYFSHATYFLHNTEMYMYMDPVYTLASLSVYPLYYWYIKLLTIETAFNWNNLVMFLPAVIVAILSTIIYLLMSEDITRNYVNAFLFRQEELHSSNGLIQIQKLVYYSGRIIFAIQVVFFLIYGTRLVVHYNEHVANFYSNLESKTLVWAKLLLYSFVFTSVLSFLFNILGRNIFDGSDLLLLIPSVIFSLLLFTIGYQGNM